MINCEALAEVVAGGIDNGDVALFSGSLVSHILFLIYILSVRSRYIKSCFGYQFSAVFSHRGPCDPPQCCPGYILFSTISCHNNPLSLLQHSPSLIRSGPKQNVVGLKGYRGESDCEEKKNAVEMKHPDAVTAIAICDSPVWWILVYGPVSVLMRR